MADLVHRILPPSRERLVVDVGCGTGANIAALSADYRCVGTDIADDAIEAARNRFPEVRFLRRLSPSDLGTLAHEADLLLLMDVLEHVQDDLGLLSELVVAAKPGAQLLITVPAGPELWSEHDSSYGHYRRYTMDTFTRLWEQLPVEPRLVSYYNSYLYPLVRASRLVTRRLPGRSLGEAGTDVRMIAPLNGVLYRTFASEARVLDHVLEGRRPRGFRRGVSLIAVLRRAPLLRRRDVLSGDDGEVSESARRSPASDATASDPAAPTPRADRSPS